jgi:hypothetical protein
MTAYITRRIAANRRTLATGMLPAFMVADLQARIAHDLHTLEGLR